MRRGPAHGHSRNGFGDVETHRRATQTNKIRHIKTKTDQILIEHRKEQNNLQHLVIIIIFFSFLIVYIQLIPFSFRSPGSTDM